MSAEYGESVVRELHDRVCNHLQRWRFPAGTEVRLLNLSENATYALTGPGGGRILRVHRVGYSSAAEIDSELAWMAALRRDGVVETAAPVAGADGCFVQQLESREGAEPRFAVAFEQLRGHEPGVGDAVRWFGRLGGITARMHEHSSSWSLPPDFRRKRWDFEAMVGPHGFWGDWHAAVGLGHSDIDMIERALHLIGQRLRVLGQGAEAFGLVHADLRLANLLVDGESLQVIDFDDCGFSWFLYDFAAAVSFIEHEPIVPELLAAWLEGYRRIRPLSTAACADIPAFIVLRRVLLTAWLASHHEIPFARTMGGAYTRGTIALAQALLRGELADRFIKR